MAKVQNTFLKSKMNKDLDARLLPDGEYRDARNVQISKSEGSQVGNLENTLGNISIEDYSFLIDESSAENIVCIGSFADELNSTVYLFFTDYNDQNPNRYVYSPTARNYIISTNILSNISTLLVKGAFLNFSQTNLITGVNVLEDLLFFTDNRNQPRVINTTLANTNSSNTNPTYYTTEDQISVAKYNPHQAIELWQRSILSTSTVQDYETTMKDVSTLFLPNGGSALCAAAGSVTANRIPLDNIIGEINFNTGAYGVGASVFLQDNLAGGDFSLTNTGVTVTTVVSPAGPGDFDVNLSGAITVLPNQKLVFNANPYFDPTFSGDPDFLESKFSRFSYRYKFTNNEYSIFAPFTQSTFIPKQDGYFMFVNPNDPTSLGSQSKNDQDEAYRSTIVYFVENKVNKISLKIPLPFNNYDMEEALKIKEIDILYKESDGIAVRVVETIPIEQITNQSGTCLVNGAQTPGVAGNPIAIKNIQGGITIGSDVFGPGIPSKTRITEFTPTDPSNPVAGNIKVDKTVSQLSNNSPLIIGDIQRFTYNYESTKPTKTLPESNLIRVYDKIPVRAQAQEVAGNRVIYGNFQNKITPPSFLDYNVTSSAKADFALYESVISYTGAAATYAAGDPIIVTLAKFTPPATDGGGLFTGYIVTCNVYGSIIPTNTQVTSTTNNTSLAAATITLSNDVTFPAGTFNIIASPGGDTEQTVTQIEYPNSSVKTNRNYQVGFVLSDRYGRQSSVILSNSTTSIISGNGQEFGGSTLYSPYINKNTNPINWPGNSLKVLMNSPVPNNNLYNGNINSVEYNPLGWYSYKVVVKQTEQEYYNVYLPGIMASYPNDTTLEVGQTSHTVLINDNINKVPRDLNEVGPDQKQFRSSVQLIGRIQNTTTSITTGNIGASNTQYYPERATDTVSVISTVNDLFDFNPIEPPLLNLFPQFYSLESNPLIARLSTEFQIGQLANTNYNPVGATSMASSSASNTITLTAASGTNTPPVTASPSANDLVDYLVVGAGIPAETYVNANSVIAAGTFTADLVDASGNNVFVNLPSDVQISFIPTDGGTAIPPFSLSRPGTQYLAVCETEPVESAIDIFWETSTSGLISDLNQAVLNNQSQPAAANILWDPDFDEGLAKDGRILTSPGFSIVDNFGATIPVSATDIVEFGAPSGDAVTNAAGENVNSSDFKDYFRLVDTQAGGTPGPWQIQTTSQTTPNSLGGPVDAAVNYFDNIYFLDEASFREFNFTFRVVIDGQENYITKQANLRNVAPLYQKITALNVDAPNEEYGPGGTNPLPGYPTPVPVKSNKAIQDIAVINIRNGSANITDPNPDSGRALSTRDLQIVNENLQDGFIFRQTINGLNGQPAQVNLNGTPTDIFSLNFEETTDGTLQYKIKNDFYQNTNLLTAGVYFIQLAIQDAGGSLVYAALKIDMSLELDEDNFYNKLQAVGAGGQYTRINTPTSQYVVTSGGQDYCGQASGCQPYGINFRWWNYPSTLFQIKSSDTGSSVDNYGWYIYAAGYFSNTVQDAIDCCDSQSDHGAASSFSLVEYSRLVNGPNSNTVTIPMNTPITGGNHLVQKQPTVADPGSFDPTDITVAQIPLWGLPPLIHGRIAITAYDDDQKLWTYEILEGDSSSVVNNGSNSGATGNALTGCMKLFRDFGGTRNAAGNGWNYNEGPIDIVTMHTRVLDGKPGSRTPRIQYTVENAGVKQFYWDQPDSTYGGGLYGYDTGGLRMLDKNWDFQGGANPQIVYTYGGPQNFITSPWFYVPTTGDTQTGSGWPIGDSYQRLWAMYTYSGWVGSQWSRNHKAWTAPPDQSGFCQIWEVDQFPPLVIGNNITQGLQRRLNDGTNSCLPYAAHLAQVNLPSEAADPADRPSNFQYAII